MKTVAIHTLGCKLNFAETSTIGRQFAERGFAVVPFDTAAEVYLLNTCSVTERADKECRQLVRRIRRIAPEAYVIVTGCYAQLRPEELAAIDGIDLILGTREKFSVFEHAGAFRKSDVPQTHVSCIDEAVDCAPAFSGEVEGRTRAFLKIQDGCDFSCSFCTIPEARGASRSLPMEVVLREARAIAERGFKEIVLTGVNVGDYGRTSGSSLLRLLRHLEGIDGIERIRVSSIEPNLLEQDLVDHILASGKCCNHFHIPLQSGSDAILKGMRRRYQRRSYADLVASIARRDPDAGIGVDVIAGFPGETDAHAEETAAFLADLPVSYLHVFTYSERPGTLADGMNGHVEPRVRFERSERLRILGQRKRAAFASRFLGRTLPVLVESADAAGEVTGLATNYLRVRLGPSPALSNTIVPATIVAVDGDKCIGNAAYHEPTQMKGDADRFSVTQFHPSTRTPSYQETP